MSARAWLALAALGLGGCACGDAPPEPAAFAASEAAVVQGTVVDAGTRAPVAGATLTAPDGSRARSDADGRFRFDALTPGLSGELVAAGSDGRVGRVPLRPLRPGSLEVVVHLRSP